MTDLQNTILCDSCKHANKPDAKFCVWCANVFAPNSQGKKSLHPNDQNICASCEYQNKPSAKFCNSCGHDLSVGVASTVPEDNTKPCPFCAEPIKIAAIKCRFCGSDLTVSSARESRSKAMPPAKYSSRSRLVSTTRAYKETLSVLLKAIPLSCLVQGITLYQKSGSLENLDAYTAL